VPVAAPSPWPLTEMRLEARTSFEQRSATYLCQRGRLQSNSLFAEPRAKVCGTGHADTPAGAQGGRVSSLGVLR
jgi:hypothetical protein